MSADVSRFATKSRLPWTAALGSLVLHLALLTALRAPEVPAHAPVSGVQPFDNRYLPVEVVAEQSAPAAPDPDARAASPQSNGSPAAPSPAAEKPRERPTPRPAAVVRRAPAASPKTEPAQPEGEDWLGVNRPRPAPEPPEAEAPTAPDHHQALIERLLAAEKRKAEARTRAAPTAAPAPAGAPPKSPSASEPQTTRAAPESATARRIQSAGSLAQAAAWTIPYACSTDPIWERPSSVAGSLDLTVELKGGRAVASRYDEQLPLHLRKLARGVSYYLEQGYRARDDGPRDGVRTLRISVRISEGPRNQSLGFDSERARSHFTLISGRRVDAEVQERPPIR